MRQLFVDGLFVYGLLMLAGSALAQTSLPPAVEAGRKAAFFCANCHGEDGNSKIPEVPNLAGQNAAYLRTQISKFANGERKDAFMQGLIKVIAETDRQNIALYYAQSTVRSASTDPGRVAEGSKLYAKLCLRCHGAQAYGNESIPRLAGQKLPYLRQSLTRYRNRSGERIDALMQIATAALTDSEIVALSHYLASLP